MKKILSILLVVLVIMVVSVSNVLAAPAEAKRATTLQRVTYERSGITLLFQSSGLTKEDLQKTAFNAHARTWEMTCSFVSDSTNVRCRVSKQLSMFAGESFHGTVAGIQFSGIIPKARSFSPIATSTPITSNTPILPETAVVMDIPIEIEAPVVTEAPPVCPVGQRLIYDFEWSGTAQSIGFITSSTTYYDQETFHSEYSMYYDQVSMTYNSEDNRYTFDYYHYNTYTFTSSGSIDPSQWADYVQNMQDLGYTVQKSGEHCEL